MEKFSIRLSQNELRQKLGLPQEKKIIVYTGHLYSWKGADVLAEASDYLSDDCLIIFVGGTETDIQNFRKKYRSRKVLIVGHKDHAEIPMWLRAADVLVLPNSDKEDISKFFTSPLKLFEYMASGVPIVASDLPSIREILNEKNSVLVKSDDPEKLADGIMKVMEDEGKASSIAKQARKNAENYTWEKRARKILEFISSCS